MATLNIRMDDKLKSSALTVMDQLGITPSELIRLIFQYVVDSGQLPIKTMVVSESESELISTVRDRLKNPQKGVKVELDEL